METIVHCTKKECIYLNPVIKACKVFARGVQGTTFSPQMFQEGREMIVSLAAASERGEVFLKRDSHVSMLPVRPTTSVLGTAEGVTHWEPVETGNPIDGRSAEGQISDRVTRKESAELSMARMKVSSLEYCSMMLSSMFTRTLESNQSTMRSQKTRDLYGDNVVCPTSGIHM